MTDSLDAKNLPNPWVCHDGTVYTPTQEGLNFYYTLWGSTLPQYRWDVSNIGDERVVLVNAVTHERVTTLPGVAEPDRPLKVDPVNRLMLEGFYKQYQEQNLDDVTKLLVHYYGNEEKLFMNLYRTFDAAVWPVHYQLLWVYARHAPTKIQNVPDLVRKYEGNYAELLKKLSDMYCNGVPIQTPKPMSDDGEYRKRLVAFYEVTGPDKLQEVDDIMSHYSTRLDDLMLILATSYPEHAQLLLPDEKYQEIQALQTAPFFNEIKKFYTQYCMDKLNTLPEAMTAAKGQEEAFLKSLYASVNVTYYCLDEIKANPYYQQIVDFYQTYNPEKISDIPDILNSYWGREEALMKDLKANYKVADTTPAAPPTATVNPYQQKVHDFYQKHNPAKLGEVQNILATYKGKEEELLRTLHQRYDVPYPPAEPAQVAQDENPFKEKVRNFYQEHNPSKLGDVDNILLTYKGREEELLKNLHARYNVTYPPEGSEDQQPVSAATPASPASVASNENPHKQKLVDFFTKHNPEKLKDVDQILASYSGKEDVMMKALHARYQVKEQEENPEQPASQVENPYRQKVHEFYQQHNPNKLGDVDNILNTYKGREEELLKSLHGRYNVPYPPVEKKEPEQPQSPTTPASPTSESPFKQRLVDFFTKHNPDKVKDADQILAAYKGKEEELMKTLHERYQAPSSPIESAPSELASSDNPYRQKVHDFYQKYNSSKLGDVGTILAAYKGREEELLRSLHARYNVPYSPTGEKQEQPQSPAAAPTSPTPDESPFKQRLVDFFTEHNPDKVKDADRVLAAYKGKEEELMKTLHERYQVPYPSEETAEGTVTEETQPSQTENVTPAVPTSPAPEESPFKQRLVDFFTSHNPGKVKDVDQILATYNGKEEELMKTLHERYQVRSEPVEEQVPSSSAQEEQPPSQGENPYRQKVHDFYQQYNPGKVGDVDTILNTYNGREEELLRNLHTRYNVPYPHENSESQNRAESPQELATEEPTSPATPQPPAAVAAAEQASSPKDNPYWQRVYNFYSKHNSQKLGSIDGLIGAFAGREEELMKSLHQRYNVPYEPHKEEEEKILNEATIVSKIGAEELVAMVPEIMKVGEATFSRSVTNGVVVFTKEGDQPSETWAAIAGNDRVVRYVPVNETMQAGYPSIQGKKTVRIAQTRDYGVNVMHEVKDKGTSTVAEVMDRNVGTAEVTTTDKSTTVEFMLDTIDAYPSIPQDSVEIGQQLLDAKAEILALKRTEKDTQVQVQHMRQKMADIMGVVETRARLADPRAGVAQEIYSELRKLNKDESLHRARTQDAEKIMKLNTVLYSKAKEESTKLTDDLKASRNRERKLLKEIATLKKELAGTREAQVAALKEVSYALTPDDKLYSLKKEIEKRDDLLWKLSQDAMSARWSDTERCLGVSESLPSMPRELTPPEAVPIPSMPVCVDRCVQTTPQETPDPVTVSVPAPPSDDLYTDSSLWKRVHGFMKEHNSEKAGSVTDIVKKYWGRDEELMKSLYKRYSVPYKSAGSIQEARPVYYKKVLTDLYKKRNPEKLEKVSGILQTYSGKEKTMVDKLGQTYGVRIPSLEEVREHAGWGLGVAVLQRYDQDNIFKVDALVGENIGKTIEQFKAVLESTYGPLEEVQWETVKAEKPEVTTATQGTGPGTVDVEDTLRELGALKMEREHDSEYREEQEEELRACRLRVAELEEIGRCRDDEMNSVLTDVEGYKQCEVIHNCAVTLYAAALSVSAVQGARPPVKRHAAFSPQKAKAAKNSSTTTRSSPTTAVSPYNAALESFHRLKALEKMSKVVG